MRYTLIPGNVAAMLYVRTETGGHHDCIFIAENQAVQVWPNRTLDIFPLAVKAAVNKHFGTLFALPLERRGAYLKSLQPQEIDA